MGASEQALRDQIWNGAVSYAEKIARDPVDNTNKSNIRTAYLWDWIIIGPFNWTFPGDIDPYSDLTLYDQNGNVIDVRNFSNYGDERWNNTHTLYSGQDFYISVRKTSGVKSISKIKAKYNIENVYNARLTFMKPASGNEKQTLLIINSTTGQRPVEFEYPYNVNLTGNLKLQKKDYDTQIPMDGVGFKFKNKDIGQWVVKNGNTYTYTTDENSATIFYTVKGEINLNGILWGNYEAKECYLPDEYKDWYELSNTSINLNYVSRGGTSNNTVTNEKVYINLSGKVWEEIGYIAKDVGEDDCDNLYTAEGRVKDKLMQNVKVYLKDARTNVDYKTPVYTDENGNYKFEDIKIGDLSNLYIEFEYNGMVYESIPIVDLNNSNSSKAEEDSREEFNVKFEQIEKDRAVNGNIELTYDTEQNTTEGEEEQISTINYGENLRYGWQEENNGASPENTNSPVYGGDSNYWITSNTSKYNLYEAYEKERESIKTTREISNINLGLKRREQPDLAVSNELYSAKLTVPSTDGTKTHIYNYSDRNNKDLLADVEQGVTNPAVQWGRLNLPTSYTRPLYASDIAKGNEEGNLSLYVTYKLSIINQSTNLVITIDSITDYFDSKYESHEFVIGKTIDDKSNVGNEIEGVIASQVAGISYNRTNEIEVNEKINPNSSVDVYLQFKVKNDEIIKLLGDGDQYADEVKLDNILEITRYSTSSKDGAAYAGIDKDSAPENFEIESHIADTEEYVENMSNYEDDTSRAPGLKIVLGNPRTTEGTVFLDETTGELTTGNVREGDGEYKDGEPGINGVQVTMYEVDENGNKTDIAKYYDNETKEWHLAQMHTDTIDGENGEYQFSGYIPGDYVIQFVWGWQKVTTSEGEEITLKVQDYKSTIVDETRWNSKQTNERWYVAENTEETRYSDAVDNYEARQTIDAETSKLTYGIKEAIEEAYVDGYNSPIIDTTIDSYTPKFKVDIEYNNAEGVTNLTDVYEMNEDGTPKVENGEAVLKDGYKNELKNIDFGIVERARQQLKLDKYISTAKLTLTTGTTIVDAKLDENGKIINPNTVKYTTGFAEHIGQPGNRKLLRIEIDDEIVQGATLTLQYNYKITNQSELDYTTQEFYMYGSARMGNDSQKVQLTPTLIDYLDNDLVIEQSTFTQNGWKLLTDTDKQNYTTGGVDQLITDSQDMKNYISGIQNISVNEENSAFQNMIPGDEGEIQLSGSRLVSTTTDGTEIANDAEIIKVEKTGGSTLTTTPGNYVPSNWQGTTETDDSRADVTIIPETGLTTNVITYVTLTISSLGILVAGIVLIKKFVLEN